MQKQMYKHVAKYMGHWSQDQMVKGSIDNVGHE